MKTTTKVQKPRTDDGQSRVTAIRIDPVDLERLKRAARLDRRSLSGFLVVAGLDRAARLEKEAQQKEDSM